MSLTATYLAVATTLTTTGRNARIFFHSDKNTQFAGFDLIVTLVPPAGEPTGIDEHIVNRPSSNRKFIQDGQLLIERNGKTYNALGVEIK